MPNYRVSLEYSYDGKCLIHEHKIVKARNSQQASKIAMAYMRKRGYKRPMSVEVWENEFYQILKPELSERD
jgi:hypothetical protein